MFRVFLIILDEFSIYPCNELFMEMIISLFLCTIVGLLNYSNIFGLLFKNKRFKTGNNVFSNYKVKGTFYLNCIFNIYVIVLQKGDSEYVTQKY